MASPARYPEIPSQRRWVVLSLRVPALLLILAGSVWPILIVIGLASIAVSLVLEHYLTRNPVQLRENAPPSPPAGFNQKTSRYQAQLEQMLTEELRRQEEGISGVSLSADGQFAIYNVGDCYTLQRLSPAAREFLKHGDVADLKKKPLILVNPQTK